MMNYMLDLADDNDDLVRTEKVGEVTEPSTNPPGRFDLRMIVLADTRAGIQPISSRKAFWIG